MRVTTRTCTKEYIYHYAVGGDMLFYDKALALLVSPIIRTKLRLKCACRSVTCSLTGTIYIVRRFCLTPYRSNTIPEPSLYVHLSHGQAVHVA